MILEIVPPTLASLEKLVRDAVEKDTAPTDNREEGTGQRILGQFHISVEE
jgi:hypothetical protein